MIIPDLPSDNVLKLLDLEAQIRNSPPAKEIDGLCAFELLPDGTLLAGGRKSVATGVEIDVVEHITEVKGDWVQEAKRLKVEQEFRGLFGTIPEDEFDEYVRIARARESART